MKIASKKLQFLIDQFSKLELDLKDALSSDDEHAVQEIDALIEVCFAQLIELDISTSSDRKIMAQFLLERITPSKNRSTLEQVICDRIVSLCSA